MLGARLGHYAAVTDDGPVIRWAGASGSGYEVAILLWTGSTTAMNR